MNTWTVYILRCRDNTLYTGVTTDLNRRISEHNAGTGAKYTRGRGPCVLVWSQDNLTESEAKREERRIKTLSRKQKEAFMNASQPSGTK